MPPVIARQRKKVATRQVVIEKVVERLLGPEGPNPPIGWHWDRRYVVEDRKSETLPLPGLKRQHLAAIPRVYWQNGPIAGKTGEALKVVDIKKVLSDGQEKWAPVIHRGDVNIWRDGSYLFSDDSVIERVSSTSLDPDSRSVHTLEKELRPSSPIAATIFRRNALNEYMPWRSYQRRERFTGLLDADGDSLTTRSGDTFYWSNVDTNRREFVSLLKDDGVLLQFAKNVSESITSIAIPTSMLSFNELEHLGDADGIDSQRLFSKYFPVNNGTEFKVYTVNTVGMTWKELDVVTTFSGPDQCKFDFDLGILTLGTTASGSTPPPVIGHAVYIAYKAVPRVEYEEFGYGDEVVALDANVNPLTQSLNRGFVTLARSELDIASIVLSTTKPSYRGSGNTFGPVYVGSDYAAITAEVRSSSGEVVPNAEVSFSIITSPPFGGIGGSSREIQKRTGFDGKAHSFYVPPVSADSMGFYVTSIGGGNTLSLSGDANLTDVSEIYTYHVLKDDPWKGKVGADTSIGEVAWEADPPNGRKVILYSWDAAAINPISGHLGAYAPVRPTVITNGNVLTYADTLAPVDPLDDDINLGAYWVVSDRFVTIQATVYSPIRGTTLISNALSFNVELPPYMKGSYIKDSLQTIPFGWRIKDTSYEVASAFNGATYISINPVAGPYPIIDVIEGETWDEYSGDNPYAFWPYNGYPTEGYVTRPFARFSIFWEVV